MTVAVEQLGSPIRELIAARGAVVLDALRPLDETTLMGPSALPGWSRLTIVCHLRFGADTLARMTDDALAGRPTAYYPGRRHLQRAATLEPRAGERPHGTIEGMAQAADALAARWAGLADEAWATAVEEPPDNIDLGPMTLARLALGRLTELEVHGTDLDIGLPDWDPAFVEIALPFRLDWLNTRRTNHRAVDEGVQGSWRLTAVDGPTYVVSVSGPSVSSRPAATEDTADCAITGTGRDLLALLLGRPMKGTMLFEGDEALAARFQSAFPGP